MESEKYLEERSFNEPPFFENNNYIERKNRFESYVKLIDQDLWHVISIGDFQPMDTNFEYQSEFPNASFVKILKQK